MLHKIITHITKFLFKNRITSKMVSGFSKRMYYEKAQHLNFLFVNKISYEPEIWNNIEGFLNESSLVFDIGGNIGQYAMKFSEKIDNKGRVISFEPDFKNFSFLQFNSAINQCKNLTCLNIGLGKKQESKTFFRDTETGGRMGSFNEIFVGNKYKGFNDIVEVDTFQNMVEIFGVPDFVKIDVEGFEYSVLEGVKQFNKETKFLIEVRESTKSDVYKIMSKNGYSCLLVDYDKPIEIKEESQIPSFANLLFY
jgi:FkbM family methyltransferase